MPILLYRVDERLIHGQVVVGWGNRLKFDQIVLVNDQVAQNTWERELYLACVPPEIKATILSVDEGVAKILQNGFEGKKAVILVDSPFEILRMVEKGVKIDSVNVGGVHFKTNRKKILPYLYLSPEEISAFMKIISAGIKCECRDVPLAEKHDLSSLFDKLGL
ncbi:MAG: PTS sugar transporter subunit IIB [candidate division Zixibacteria bacterium]|nr:PTS sugar transporter subunit IIB [candidate division Zixibacteria bacterium]